VTSLEDVDALLLDVDGTLVDTTYLHAWLWSEAFAERGHARPVADLHGLIGMDSERLIATALADAPPAAQLVEDLSRRHLQLYEPHWPRLRPLPGARLLLQRVHDAGRRVVLVTSAGDAELRALRAALDADQHIDAATTSDDVESGKPEPDVVAIALQRAGAAPERALLVGDSVWDGEAAQRAGVRFVGVTSGGICEHQLREAGAVNVYRDAAELAAHLGTGQSSPSS